MHHKAILTDRDVDLVLELRSAGWLYREIAAKMEASKSTIKDICKGLTRARCG
jgi:transcriptional regulator